MEMGDGPLFVIGLYLHPSIPTSSMCENVLDGLHHIIHIIGRHVREEGEGTYPL
jgi:hypothetical protein